MWRDPVSKKEKEKKSGQWWHTPLIPALRKQRQVDLCEFGARVVYNSEFQGRFQTYRETLFKKKRKKEKKKR